MTPKEEADRANARIKEIRSIQSKCRHEHHEPSVRVVDGGQIQVMDQCTDCGLFLSSALGGYKSCDKSSLRKADTKIIKELDILYGLVQRKRSEQLDQEIEAKNKEKETRRDCYDRFLASNAWGDMRILVLKRDGYLCQGCLVNRATQVHHINYNEPIGNEFMFDLVSLCGPCHKRYHNR